MKLFEEFREYETMWDISLDESAGFVPAPTVPSSGKFALAYVFWDYGWYWETIDKNSDGDSCATTHRTNRKFCGDKVYTGRLFSSVEECFAEVANNKDKYLPYALPENIDYASGRKNGTIGAIELNADFDGYVKIIRLFDCKARKLVKAR